MSDQDLQPAIDLVMQVFEEQNKDRIRYRYAVLEHVNYVRQQELDDYGAMGWELVTVTTRHVPRGKHDTDLIYSLFMKFGYKKHE